MRASLLLFLLLATRSATLAGQATIQTFGNDTFTLSLPAGYQLLGQSSPGSGLRVFAYATAQRANGTRSLIQVSLIDLDQAAPGSPPTVDEVAAAMIGGVRQRREQWEQTESAVEVAAVPAKRIAWSGTNAPSPERPSQQPASAMHGAMIVGIKGNIAFTLHTQDVDPFALTTVPECEQALMGFTLAVHPQ